MTPDELIKFTGATGDAVEHQAAEAIKAAEALISGYCRGRDRDQWGDYRPGVESVRNTVAARILANPGQVSTREQIGPYSHFTGEGFTGFTLPELAVLNRYRKRAVGP